MLFFFLRHGDPIYEPDSLTSLGHRQAEALGKRLARYGLDEIYASSSVRAMQTAEPTAELLHKEIVPLDWCREDLAWKELAPLAENGQEKWAFQQERFRRLFVSPEIQRLGEDWPEHPAFSEIDLGKGIRRIQTETDRFFLRLGYEHDRVNHCYYHSGGIDSRRIALFAHQGFGLAFLSCVTDIPYPQFCAHFDICHSGMTVLDFSAVNDVVIPKILELSGDAHIYHENLPTNYNNEFRF